MTNEVNQDAEESATIEKTAEEQTESTMEQSQAAISEPEAAVAAENPVANTDEAPVAVESSAPTVEISPESEVSVEAPAPAEASAEAAPEARSEPEAAAAADEDADGPSSAGASPAQSDTGASAEADAAPTPPVRPQYRTITVPKPIRVEPPPAPAAPPTPAARTASASPKSIDATDDQTGGDIDFGAILEQFEQEQTVFHVGELVEGKVVGITDRGVLVDFGYKSEGFVPPEEFTGPGGEMLAVVGDDVEVIIRNISGDGAPQLSRIDALGRKVWDDIEAAFNAETPVTGRVVDKTKGGLRLDINGVEAFLPGSQIDSRPARNLDTYIGQDIEALVIKFSRRRNNIVLSRKVITDKVVNAQKAETLGQIEVGYIVDGTIKNLTEYGAFVDIGGIDGLLHVTDMSWGRIHHPGDVFKVGEHIQVKVLKLDREKEKISLGYKQLLPDPWSTVVEVYPVNTKLKGTVSSVTEYGVFVELEAGVEGLVHVSEISWARRAQSPKRLFNRGQEVEVQVLGVDTVEKRISLGMKQFQENPWDMVDIKYPVGAKVQGRVRNITDFGAFVELEEGIDGLVHVSDITWAKKIKHPKDVLKKDQEVEAIVTSIDKRGQRLSLSMKDLTPSAWEGFVATHRPGDVVRGKVSRFTNFGVFVELGEGLEGLCHISELSDERVDRPESVAELGQEMDFKILRIEPGDQKIGLSHRAVGKGEEAATGTAESRIYSTEAKGGMASLGELAKLRSGGEEAAPVVEKDPEEKKRAKAAVKKAKAEEFAAREAEAEKEGETPAEEPAEETAGMPETEAPAEEPAAETRSEDETPAEMQSPEAGHDAEEPAIETAVDEAPSATEEPASDASEEKPVEEPASGASEEKQVEEPEPEATSEATPALEQEGSTEVIAEPETAATMDEPVIESAATSETDVPEAKAEETTSADTEASAQEAPAAEGTADETPAEESEKKSA